MVWSSSCCCLFLASHYMAVSRSLYGRRRGKSKKILTFSFVVRSSTIPTNWFFLLAGANPCCVVVVSSRCLVHFLRSANVAISVIRIWCICALRLCVSSLSLSLAGEECQGSGWVYYFIIFASETL